MLPHPTLERLTSMGFAGMARAYGELAANPETDRLSHPEWLALLLDREWSFRHDRKLAARLRFAKLRHHATPEDIDYRSTRGLDRALLMKLVAGDWIAARDNLVITGPTGVGKSWLACALGHKGLSRRPLGPLPACAAAFREPGARARRRPPRPAPANPWQRPAAYPRRLGSGAAGCDGAP